MEADSNHRFQKSNSPDFSVGFDPQRRGPECLAASGIIFR
jgi:hypothetical protein